MNDPERCPFCGTPYSQRSWACDRLMCKEPASLVRYPEKVPEAVGEERKDKEFA